MRWESSRGEVQAADDSPHLTRQRQSGLQPLSDFRPQNPEPHKCVQYGEAGNQADLRAPRFRPIDAKASPIFDHGAPNTMSDLTQQIN
jgi:hypothetical protein